MSRTIKSKKSGAYEYTSNNYDNYGGDETSGRKTKDRTHRKERRAIANKFSKRSEYGSPKEFYDD